MMAFLRFLPIVGLVAVVGFGWIQWQRAERLKEQRDVARSEAEGLRIGMREMEAHQERMDDLQRVLSEELQGLERQEGYNAPLSDFLRNASRGL